MVDLEELKRLAEKATPGPWWIDSHGMNMASMAGGENFAAQVFAPKPYHEKAIRHEETGNLSHWRNDWDASFIAAANPAAVLELIEEVERLRAILDDPEYPPNHARRLIAELRAEVDDYKRGAEVEAKLGDEARAELRHAREQLQSLIDQTAPLEPVPGDPKWSRRIQLDEVITERDQLRAELDELALKFAASDYSYDQSTEQLRAEVEALRMLAAECNDYLNFNELTNIAHGSILHRKLADAAMAAKEGE